MKTFSTSGPGNQQTLSEIESDKMPIYDSLTDVEADLANLSVGQIVATKDTGSELSAPVDVIQNGNMHAVTSNAVAEKVAIINNSLENKLTTINSNATKSTINNRTNEQIVSLGLQDTNNSGLTIDFDYNTGVIRIYYILNGITQGVKTIQ